MSGDRDEQDTPLGKLVLVPLDASALSDTILAHVERWLGQEPFDVLLVRVLPLEPFDDDPSRMRLDREAAEAHLTAARRNLEELGARVTTELRAGDPAAEILAALEEHRPSLVAMSSHGRSGVLRWIRGSVAERVLRSCTAPLLLATPRAGGAASDRLRRILVPLDGSDRSAATLPLVEGLARRHGAEVVLLRVEWETLSRPVLAAMLTPERVAESLRPWLDRLTRRGITARVLAAQGDFAAQILDVADREHCDLIAMSTHGRSGLARLVDGSVSEQVLRHCGTPLLVVRAR